MSLIWELKKLLEQLSNDEQKSAKWLVYQILSHLVPYWDEYSPQDAIFSSTKGTPEATVRVFYTKRDGIFLNFSKRPFNKRNAFKLFTININTDVQENNLIITVVFTPTSYISKITGQDLKKLGCSSVIDSFTVPLSQLGSHPINISSLLDRPKLKQIKECILKVFDTLKVF